MCPLTPKGKYGANLCLSSKDWVIGVHNNKVDWVSLSASLWYKDSDLNLVNYIWIFFNI